MEQVIIKQLSYEKIVSTVNPKKYYHNHETII